jgi:mannose-6-phosphate isomerase class I
LHVEKALNVIQFGRPIGAKTSRIRLRAHGSDVALIAACRYFATERWKIRAETDVPTHAEHFELLVILTGNGNLTWETGSAKFRNGECWLIPAGIEKLALAPGSLLKILRTYVPDLVALRARLKDAGRGFQAIEKTIFD